MLHAALELDVDSVVLLVISEIQYQSVRVVYGVIVNSLIFFFFFLGGGGGGRWLLATLLQ
jgi:hypothetical protein